MSPYPRSRRRSARRGSIGHERALEHIRQAEALSRALGGTDEDVKRYFFSLTGRTLKSLLEEYGRLHGASARTYAEQTIPHWRSERRTMSGLVAARLYALLPPRMALSEKYGLVKRLWNHHGPRSHKVLVVGPDASEGEVIERARAQVLAAVQSYTVPAPLEARFRWLATGDVSAYQQLLNHFLDLEKQQAIELTAQQIPVMMSHLRSHGATTHRLSQILQIGNHKVEIHFQATASGVRESEPGRLALTQEANRAWLWWFLAILGALIFFALQSN